MIEWPLRAVCRSLGRVRGLLRTFSSLQASKVAARELRLLNFLAILEREASAQIGEGLTCARRAWMYFWQLGSTATETTGGVIVVTFWPKHGLRSDLRVPNFKNFPG